jgi:hypothetical protein
MAMNSARIATATKKAIPKVCLTDNRKSGSAGSWYANPKAVTITAAKNASDRLFIEKVGAPRPNY